MKLFRTVLCLTMVMAVLVSIVAVSCAMADECSKGGSHNLLDSTYEEESTFEGYTPSGHKYHVSGFKVCSKCGYVVYCYDAYRTEPHSFSGRRVMGAHVGHTQTHMYRFYCKDSNCPFYLSKALPCNKTDCISEIILD